MTHKTWTDIADTVLEPGDPVRSVDMLALRDNPIAMAEGAAGAPILPKQWIDSGSESSVASLVFTGLTDDFRAHKLAFDNLVPGGDGAFFNMRTSVDNGSNFAAGSTDYGIIRHIGDVTSAQVGISGSNTNNAMSLSSSHGTAAGEESSGKIVINNPMNAGARTIVHGRFGHYSDAGNIMLINSVGIRRADEANNAVEFAFSAGLDIGSMNWTLYGQRAGATS